MSEDLDYLPRRAASWRGLQPMLRRLERESGDRIPRGDVALANRDMRHLGCRTRYRADGTPFLLAPGEAEPDEAGRDAGNAMAGAGRAIGRNWR